MNVSRACPSRAHRAVAAALGTGLAALGLAALPPTAGAHAATVVGSPAASAAAAADRAVAARPGALRASGSDAFSRRGGVVVDRDGVGHVRYDRTYRGLRVLGGDSVVHLSKDGALRGVSQTLRAPLGLGTRPAVTRARAEQVGRGVLRGTVGAVSSELVVDATRAVPRLAYDVLVTGVRADQTPARLHVIVDAVDGTVLRSSDDVRTGTGRSIYSGNVSIGTQRNGGQYEMKDPVRGGNWATDLNGRTDPAFGTKPAGTLFVDADDVWGNNATSDRASAGVDAHFGAQTTYDYFKNVQGRNGIFGDGRGVRSRVHYGNAYANAFWDGTQMTYGDGAGNARPLTSLDIAGHEMTHGVTENTAGLTYSGESGGLNEATSDIFGTMVEFYAGNASDAGDYLVGEKVDINGNGTPLRYMDRPSRDGRSADCWSSTVGTLDVHYSSGPGNHAFYLMAEGSGAKTINGVGYDSPTCNGSTVTGIGRDAAARIWYRALSVYMTSSTSYAGARQAAVNAAKDLYGATSAQCAGVESAFSAINVSGATCATPPPPTGGNLVVNPGFESGAASWTASSGVVTNDAAKARAGSWLAWLNGYGTARTDTVSQQVSIPAASAATLSLWLRVVSSETTTTSAYDTFRVQVVSGTTTTTLGTYSNLNKGSSYVPRSFNVASFAGRTVTVKLVGAEDSSLATSFYVDDVSLTTG